MEIRTKFNSYDPGKGGFGFETIAVDNLASSASWLLDTLPGGIVKKPIVYVFPNELCLQSLLALTATLTLTILTTVMARPASGGTGRSCILPPVTAVESESFQKTGDSMTRRATPPIDVPKHSSLATAVFGLG